MTQIAQRVLGVEDPEHAEAEGAIRVPARLAFALGGIVASATFMHAVIALRSPSIWIVPDELIYSELAKSLGGGGLPSVRSDVSFDWGLGYSLLLAPMWAAFDDPATAYTGAKVLNALLLGLTSIPAFFLGRRFVTDGYALVLAGLSVSVPSMLFAGTLMTEVALYPAVTLALLTVAVALERPQVGTQLAALGAIALACTIKTLAIVLVVAYVGAIGLYHWLDTSDRSEWRMRLRRYSSTWLVLTAAGFVSATLVLAYGRRPQEILGTYSSVIDHLDLKAAPRWALLHVAEFDLSLAFIPFAATLVVAGHGLRRRAPGQMRLFASLVVPIFILWIGAVAAFASVPFLEVFKYPQNLQRLQERSVFVLAPLFLLGLLLWLRDRPGRPRVLVTAIVVSALLPSLIPIDDFDRNVRFQALALVPWVELRDDVAWPAGVLLFGLALGLIFLFAMRIHAPALLVLAPIVLVFAVVTITAHRSMLWASEWTRSAAWGGAPNWVDAAVDEGDTVSVLWAEPPGEPFVDLAARHRIVFVGEFFNRSIGTVYELGSPLPYDLPTTPVELRDGRVVLEDGTTAPLGELVLVPCHVRVAGTPVARDPGTGAAVIRVDTPVRAVVGSPESCPVGAT